MNEIKQLSFLPFWGLSSKHLQMILAAFMPQKRTVDSIQKLVSVGKEDQLSCEISIPGSWKHNDQTIVLIHGLGGSHSSNYMVRMARKLYEMGHKVVRANLRNCGSGKELSKQPYHAGNSEDIFEVLRILKIEFPRSNISMIGFSLGGNIALKLAGELGTEAGNYLSKVIAICPPFDLERTVRLIEKNSFYLQYYLKSIYKQSIPWTTKKFQSLYEFDDKITGPSWGYSGAKEYYDNCSSRHFLSRIDVATHILCAEDDPFVSINHLDKIALSPSVQLYTTKYGSHMGFIGRKKLRWLDDLLLSWVNKG